MTPANGRVAHMINMPANNRTPLTPRGSSEHAQDLENFTEIPIDPVDNSEQRALNQTEDTEDTVVTVPTEPSGCPRVTPDKKQLQYSKMISKYIFVVVGHIVLFFGYTTFMFAISLQTPMPAWNKAVFMTIASILNVIVFICYWATMSTAAGSAPLIYKIPDIYLVRHEEGPVTGVNEKAANVLPTPVYTRDKSGNLRFCRTCVAVKPDRSHHCYTCGTCTLRFDHHCPWMGRCIGHGNHKLFYLFTMYGFGLALFYVATTLYVAIQYFTGAIELPTCIIVLDMVILVTSFFFGCCFVGWLFVSHTHLILRNKTTFESLRPQQTVADLQKGEMLFDNGFYKNWTSVMGEKPLLWFVPYPNIQAGDGSSFPLNPKYTTPAA